MPRVKKWIWKLVETDEYVEVPDHIPPIGKPKGTYPLPVAMPKPQPLQEGFATHVDTTLLNPFVAEMTKVVAEVTKKAAYDLGPPPVLGATWNPVWDTKVPATPKPKAARAADEFAALDHPYVGGKFTLFVLCYGAHLDLAERCLESVINTLPAERFDLRVALNQPSPELEGYVGSLHTAGVVTKVYTDYGDRKKYPAMRRMFRDDACPIKTPYVCWFDDDSWCRKADWATLLAQTIVANQQHGGRLYGAWHYHDLMSVKRHSPLAPGEKWFREASWWRGKNLYTGSGRRTAPNGSQIVFASGGFWALATHVIREADIPDERLTHNGGDITLGAQVTQAGYKVVDFSPKPKKEIIAWSDAPPRGTSHKPSDGPKQFPWS